MVSKTTRFLSNNVTIAVVTLQHNEVISIVTATLILVFVVCVETFKNMFAHALYCHSPSQYTIVLYYMIDVMEKTGREPTLEDHCWVRSIVLHVHVYHSM